MLLQEARAPLHYREMTRRMLEQGLWQTTGKTPVDTVSARLDRRHHHARPGVALPTHGGGRLRAASLGLARVRAHRLGQATRQRQSDRARDRLNQVRDALRTPAATQPRDDAEAPETLSFTDATEHVLQRVADGKPMHYRDITRHALRLGLLRTEGRTPEATLYAQLLSENARRARRGEPPRFVKLGSGMVGLARWQGRGLAGDIERHNAEVRKQLHARLHSMDPGDFEALVGRLLAAIGFDDVVVTARSGDGGIDVRGTLVVGDVIRTRMAVQVKRWKQGVQRPLVQQVRGSLGAHEQGLIITTGDFSAGAREEARRADATPVGLMNGEQLVALLVEHDIGVRRTTHDLIELGDVEPE